MTEMEYLEYDDWFSKLRRAFAKNEEVFFISLTKEKKLITIRHDGYNALFFPVKNPKQRQSRGRLWYENDEISSWLHRFNPDVMHIIGSGSQMALNVLKKVREPLSFLWERNVVNKNTLMWEDLDLCDYYVHPTLDSIKRAMARVPKEKLLKVPLGADTDFFKPVKLEKQFDIVSVGVLTPRKQIDKIQKIVCQRKYSWIHSGGYVKGPPYTKVEDLFFFRKLRKLFSKYPQKKSYSGDICSGRFSHQQMPLIYNRSRIMVHPALFEGAARAVQEALCCELPVVVLKKAVPWVEPEFGIAVDEISQLDEAVRSLLSDNNKIKKMGKNGRDWLIANHSFSHLYDVVAGFNQMKKPEKEKCPRT
jgi:glycosyltransferase involved in cell wall biosynthesis